jgi:hypothetical protein
MPRRFIPRVPLNPIELDIYAANGAKMNILGWTRIEFTIAGIVTTADLLVSDEVGDLMLGYDWLVDQDVTWDFMEKIIIFKGIVIPLKERAVRVSVVRNVCWGRPPPAPVVQRGPPPVYAGRPVVITGPFAGHTLNPETMEFGPPEEAEAAAQRLLSKLCRPERPKKSVHWGLPGEVKGMSGGVAGVRRFVGQKFQERDSIPKGRLGQYVLHTRVNKRRRRLPRRNTVRRVPDVYRGNLNTGGGYRSARCLMGWRGGGRFCPGASMET